MRNWIRNTQVALGSAKGESLIESVISLLILSILMLAVAAILTTSLNITVRAVGNATALQEDTVNTIIMSDLSDGEEGDIAFRFEDAASGIDIFSTHEIMCTDDEIFAFEPK